MSRKEIYSEITESFGKVPKIFKVIPVEILSSEWKLSREETKGAITGKERALLGLAISTATGCHQSALFYSELAKLNHASDAEVGAVIETARSGLGLAEELGCGVVEYDQCHDEELKLEVSVGP